MPSSGLAEGWEPFIGNDAGIVIVPQGEIEDIKRVHHVILAEDPAQLTSSATCSKVPARASRQAAVPTCT